MIDLGPRSRVAFAALWVGVQVVIVTTASRRADGVFGFCGVRQSNVVRVHLAREVERDGERRTVPVANGEWIAKDEHGEPRRFGWADRVRDPALRRTDEPVATTVPSAELAARARAAVDDVARHGAADKETRALVVTLSVATNGHEPQDVTLRAGWP